MKLVSCYTCRKFEGEKPTEVMNLAFRFESDTAAQSVVVGIPLGTDLDGVMNSLRKATYEIEKIRSKVEGMY